MVRPAIKLLVIGAGSIGGVVGAHLIRSGHDLTFSEIDDEHRNAINSDGLTIEFQGEQRNVKAKALAPTELNEDFDIVFLAVKGHQTDSAIAQIASSLRPDGYVVTLQNGLVSETLIKKFGANRVVPALVNFGADYISPGLIKQGNEATVRVGEISGEISTRVSTLADLIPYAQATENIVGYLWSKEVYGAMLFAGAVSDLPIVESLGRPEYRDLMLALAREVMAQAPVKLEPFDGFDPEDLESSIEGLVELNRNSAKSHSGVYRDLAVRKRKTEVSVMKETLDSPLVNLVIEMIESIERGERICQVANLDLLATYESAIRKGTSLNAYVDLLSAPLRSTSGPLLGRAIAVKDIMDIAGVPRGNGNPIDMAGTPAKGDSPIVRNLRNLGADIFATTTLLEYAAGALHPDVPEALNSANPAFTAGGSSGGSAAMVGAGICQVTLGTDTGGSIRIPAHYCGVAGFKPTYGTFDLTGVTALAPTLDHLGLIGDTPASILEVFTALTHSESPTTPGKVTFGVITERNSSKVLEPEVEEAIDRAVAALVTAGHSVVEVDGSTLDLIDTTFGPIVMYELFQVHEERARNHPEHYGLPTLRLIQASGDVSEVEYQKAMKTRSDNLAKASEIYLGIDALISPCAPYNAPLTTPPIDTVEGEVEALFTATFNVTGDPAISIPIGIGKNNLPFALQLSAARGEDLALLAIADACYSTIFKYL